MKKDILLSFKDILLLLGNNFARGKVVAESKMVSELINSSSKDNVVVEKDPKVFLSCAVTQAQAKKLNQKQTISTKFWLSVIKMVAIEV